MKRIFVLSFALFSLMSKSALAQSTANSNSSRLGAGTAAAATDSFVVGAQLENFNYNEPKMNDQGLLYGVAGKYDHLLASRSLLEVEFELVTGRADYSGETWGGQPLTLSNQFTIYQVEGHYRAKELLPPQSPWSPQAGLGYRSTSQDKESTGDYRRDYYYIYVEAGLQYEVPVDVRAKFIFRAQGDLLIGGSNTTHLSDVAGSGMPDVTMNYTSGSAYRLEAEYDYRLQDNHQIQGSFHLTAWDVQPSETVSTGPGQTVVEPSNQTYLVGLNVGYLF